MDVFVTCLMLFSLVAVTFAAAIGVALIGDAICDELNRDDKRGE